MALAMDLYGGAMLTTQVVLVLVIFCFHDGAIKRPIGRTDDHEHVPTLEQSRLVAF